MPSAEGVITIVQEGRFTLATDEGRVLRLILAHGAALEPQDLPALARDRRHVRVDYTPSHGLIAATAQGIHWIPEHRS